MDEGAFAGAEDPGCDSAVAMAGLSHATLVQPAGRQYPPQRVKWPPMRHRLTAWMALFAMLTGIALPAHAYRIHAAKGLAGADFCTTVKLPDGATGNSANATADAPPSQERDHAIQCDSCCGCGGVAAAPALPRSWPTLATASAMPADLPATHQHAVAGFALARGPPVRT